MDLTFCCHFHVARPLRKYIPRNRKKATLVIATLVHCLGLYIKLSNIHTKGSVLWIRLCWDDLDLLVSGRGQSALYQAELFSLFSLVAGGTGLFRSKNQIFIFSLKWHILDIEDNPDKIEEASEPVLNDEALQWKICMCCWLRQCATKTTWYRRWGCPQ